MFDLKQSSVAIVGLGLMGGSLALALRGHCARLLGIDPDPAARDLALRQHIVDQAEADPAALLPQSDLIILSAPVPAILTLLHDLPDLTPNPAIVFDLGSTKAQICQQMARLPERFDPIGGHPICGKERLSLANAERTLYYAAPFILTPLPRTTPRAHAAAQQIITAIGARPILLDPSAHDRILARTSHLPYLLAAALVLTTPQDCAPLIGPGFRSTSRLAGTPPSMMLGVLQTNRANILAALEALQDELALLTAALSEYDDQTLHLTLTAALEKYNHLISQ